MMWLKVSVIYRSGWLQLVHISCELIINKRVWFALQNRRKGPHISWLEVDCTVITRRCVFTFSGAGPQVAVKIIRVVRLWNKREKQLAWNNCGLRANDTGKQNKSHRAFNKYAHLPPAINFPHEHTSPSFFFFFPPDSCTCTHHWIIQNWNWLHCIQNRAD